MLLLIAGSSFKSSLGMSILFFVMFLISLLLICVDYFFNLVSLTSSGVVFQKILWKKLTTWSVCIGWNEVEKVATSTYGFFNLLKSTQIEGKNKESIRVFSFMEDYLHFLKEVSQQAKSAHIDKLTLDLLAGRADV